MRKIWKAALLLAVICHMTLGLTVQTKYGEVEGQTLTLNDGRKVNSFLGVPFAKPPVGKLRWKAPEEPETWQKPFKANKLRSACQQSPVGLIYITHIGWDDYSEDCLHLNIYTPKDLSKGPYPVMVFYHGGGFSGGANFQYPGYFLALRDIIVVTVNYRLGALGFASTKDAASPGNYGLLDQQKALMFVRDNIRNFGGDPKKVTISGQSAGGASVGLQVVSPLAKGLFHQAILQSGTDLNTWSLQGPEQKPWTYTEQLAESLNCPKSDHEKMMDCLRQKPATDFNGFQPNCTKGFVCLGFGPVVDGKVITEHPNILRNRSDFTKVPMMAGITEQDGSLVAAILSDEINSEEGISYEEFDKLLQQTIGYALPGEPEVYKKVYEAVKFYHTPWGQQSNKTVNRIAIRDFVTDAAFGYPWDLVTKYAAPFSPTYSYVYRYRSKQVSDILPGWMGVIHAFELPYVFGFPFLTKNDQILDEAKTTVDLIIEWNKEDERMADLTMDLWSNFVKTGNPTPKPIKMDDDQSLTWNKFELTNKSTLIIDSKPSIAARYRQQEYALLTEYVMYLLSN